MGQHPRRAESREQHELGFWKEREITTAVIVAAASPKEREYKLQTPASNVANHNQHTSGNLRHKLCVSAVFPPPFATCSAAANRAGVCDASLAHSWLPGRGSLGADQNQALGFKRTGSEGRRGDQRGQAAREGRGRGRYLARAGRGAGGRGSVECTCLGHPLMISATFPPFEDVPVRLRSSTRTFCE